jgi:hypothetical protein
MESPEIRQIQEGHLKRHYHSNSLLIEHLGENQSFLKSQNGTHHKYFQLHNKICYLDQILCVL